MNADWLNVVERLGYPVAVSAVLAVAIWKAFRFLAPIVREASKTHLEFVNHISAQQTEMRVLVAGVVARDDDHDRRKFEKLDAIHDDVNRVGDKVDQVLVTQLQSQK